MRPLGTIGYFAYATLMNVRVAFGFPVKMVGDDGLPNLIAVDWNIYGDRISLGWCPEAHGDAPLQYRG